MLILHVSDIHFKKAEIETAQDPNLRLRNEILRDVQRQSAKLGRPDAIIVGGDVAFAGDSEEFAFATSWLAELCGACGCSLDTVFVCPGNHDVLRQRADRKMVQLVHQAIKEANDPTARSAS